MLAKTDVRMELDLHSDYVLFSTDVDITTSIHDQQLIAAITRL